MPHHDLVVLLDLHAADLVVLQGLTAEVQHRGGPADDLVDHRVGVLVGVALVELPLVGELEEAVHAAGDGVAGRLVAGDAQQQEEHVELDFVERLAVDVGRQQCRDDVVGRLVAAFLLERVGVGEQLAERTHHVLFALGEVGIVGTDHRVGPVEDLRAVLERDADHLGDRLERQFGRQFGDELRRSALAHPVDDHLRAVVEVVLEQVDHARGEARG